MLSNGYFASLFKCICNWWQSYFPKNSQVAEITVPAALATSRSKTVSTKARHIAKGAGENKQMARFATCGKQTEKLGELLSNCNDISGPEFAGKPCVRRDMSVVKPATVRSTVIEPAAVAASPAPPVFGKKTSSPVTSDTISVFRPNAVLTIGIVPKAAAVEPLPGKRADELVAVAKPAGDDSTSEVRKVNHASTKVRKGLGKRGTQKKRVRKPGASVRPKSARAVGATQRRARNQ